MKPKGQSNLLRRKRTDNAIAKRTKGRMTKRQQKVHNTT